MPDLLLALLLLQTTPFERISERPIHDVYVLTLVPDLTQPKGSTHLVLKEKTDRSRSWELDTIDLLYCCEFVRADRTSVVLRKHSDYRFIGPYLKLFFDLVSKKVLKRIEYADTALSQISDPESQRFLGAPPEFINLLKTPSDALSPFAQRTLPKELLATPLPQSMYTEFARARPARVRDGYTKESTIREVIGPYQIVDGKIWFGKNFYDGEGTTGVGAIGCFDRSTKKYTFLHIAQVADWSVSNLLVEGDTLWASLVRHPEGADYSGGLIRHDLKSGVTQKNPVGEVIFRIERWRDGLYLTTSKGIYVLKDDRLTRYLIEPDINGKPVIISEQL
jgi:hypothetical protein